MRQRHFFLIRNFFLPVLLLTIVFISFSEVRHHDFIDSFDDNVYVTDNPNITSGVTLENLRWAFTAKVSANWHPVTLISHMIDCQLLGLDAGKHHLMNLVFHILNILLLFIILRQMTGRYWESLIAAAFFGLHPIHVESVAWISERKDVLSTFFALLTIWSYAWYAKQPTVKRYISIFFFYLMGIMSKPMIVTLPFVLLLLDYWPLQRFDLNKANKKDPSVNTPKTPVLYLVLEKTPLFLLSAFSSIITFRFQKFIGDAQTPDIYPLSLRISNAIVSYTKYIYKLFYPSNLSILYPFPEQIPAWQVISASILLIIITGFVIRKGVRHKFLPVGWFWYLGTLVPVIGIVRVGAQAMADRYMYIPSIGLFILIVWCVSISFEKWKNKHLFFILLSFIIIFLLVLATRLQVRHWSNAIILFEHAVALDPTNTFAHNHLGVIMSRYGLRNETVRHTSEGLRNHQNRPPGKRFDDDRLNQTYVKTYTALGKSLLKKDNIDPAIIHFKEALLADPNYKEAQIGLENALVTQQKEIEEAKKIMEALENDPENDDLYLKLAYFYKRRGKLEMAEVQYQKVLNIHPTNMNALMKLAELNAIRGRYDKSLERYRQAADIEPDNPEPFYQISSIYARRRKIDLSIGWLKKAIDNGYNDWERLKKDKSLQTIHGTSYYEELVKSKPAANN